ncbi:hypothetical protein L596_025338 [Steinernema carpocapsae]|uniref:Uncharacterized protein n=1 Tax=Steinernema carpocapsae TaxID=34508 RepID=A0A4U5M7H1_STECR|nr:hypothetical protein L596_025338 [Steinernema carpocapsae]
MVSSEPKEMLMAVLRLRIKCLYVALVASVVLFSCTLSVALGFFLSMATFLSAVTVFTLHRGFRNQHLKFMYAYLVQSFITSFLAIFAFFFTALLTWGHHFYPGSWEYLLMEQIFDLCKVHSLLRGFFAFGIIPVAFGFTTVVVLFEFHFRRVCSFNMYRLQFHS